MRIPSPSPVRLLFSPLSLGLIIRFIFRGVILAELHREFFWCGLLRHSVFEKAVEFFAAEYEMTQAAIRAQQAASNQPVHRRNAQAAQIGGSRL
jgi:hypothetical protein